MKTFTQGQNEALVLLMLAGRRQDGVVSLSEGDEFAAQVQSLRWSGQHDAEFFIVTEGAKIRKTLAKKRESFLADQCACFKTPAEKDAVVAAIEAVLRADGVDPRESDFMADVRRHLML